MIFAHRRVMAAIEAGDGDAAERRMARHIGAYVRHIVAHRSVEIELSAMD